MRQRSLAMSNVLTAVLSASVLFFGSAALLAHDGGTTGYAAITIDRQMVRYELTLSSIPAGPLADQIAGQMAAQGPSGAIADRRAELLAEAIAAHLHLSNNDVVCQAGPRRTAPAKRDVLSVTALVDFVCRDEIRALRIRDALFDVLGDDLHTLAKIDWASGSAQFAFGPDARETLITLTADDDVSANSDATSFFSLGVEHILSGYDHLLFLLALILCGGGLLQTLKIVTAFTIAHSLTLALAALDVIVFPSRWVEALIALSIVYVAAENLYPRYALSRRWVVSFVFGAVHGFGFATILREAGLEDANLLWSLFNFNLGVEVGQAAIVMICLPVLIYYRGRRWERRVTRSISAAVLVIGLALFVERALF